MKAKPEEIEDSPVEKDTVLFHIEFPIELTAALEADAKKSGRSRRAHAAYLLAQIVEKGGSDFLLSKKAFDALS